MKRVILLLLLFLVACAHQAAFRIDTPRRILRPEEVHVRAGDDPLLPGQSGYSAGTVFEEAFRAFEAHDLDRSRALYERLILEFPDASERLSARYNLALIYQTTRNWEAAAEQLQRWLDEAPPEPALDRAQGRVRFAQVLQRLTRFAESTPLLRDALASGILEQEDRWEATALLARALAQGGSFAEGEMALSRVQRELDSAARADGIRHGWHAALAWFVVAETDRLRGKAIPLDDVEDAERAAAVLDEKAALYLRAREHYRRAIAGRIPDWSGAAAYGLGQVFEDFRADWLEAPVPATITDPDELAAYRSLLEERTRIFLEKAVADYRNLIDLAPRYDLAPEWVEALRAAKERCIEELLRLEERARMRPSPARLPVDE